MLKGLASPTTPVSKIMTPQESLAVLTPQHSVLEAMDLMVKYNVRHVPVVSIGCVCVTRSLLMSLVFTVMQHQMCRWSARLPTWPVCCP
jgi:signal-transduction protein with cAMP-binding, CBS, and nucleotidyltransferase domain